MAANGHNTTRPLFGGAIKAIIPPHFLDASNFRDVPDNQEVFVSNLSETSLIFDILERVDVPDSESAEYHFDALAIDNEVNEDDTDDSHIYSITQLPPSTHPKLDVPCWTLLGYQRIIKGHYGSSSRSAGTGQFVVIYLVVFRLEGKGTDFVVSLNFPVYGAESEVFEGDEEGVKRFIERKEGLMDCEGILKDIISSIEILDWDLFDEDEE